MDLKLDPESVTSIAAAAIFDHLTQEARDSVLKQAVASLLTPEMGSLRTSYGKSPLQEAFESAIRSAAYQVVQERIKDDPEVNAAIHELLGPLITGALDAEAENWNTGLADAIGGAVGTWLAEAARERRG